MAQLFVTLQDQIACVEREIGFRRRVYAHRVGKGTMTQQKADYEIEVMTAVLDTLQHLKEQAP